MPKMAGRQPSLLALGGSIIQAGNVSGLVTGLSESVFAQLVCLLEKGPGSSVLLVAFGFFSLGKGINPPQKSKFGRLV
jgi:hypothetical protein